MKPAPGRGTNGRRSGRVLAGGSVGLCGLLAVWGCDSGMSSTPDAGDDVTPFLPTDLFPDFPFGRSLDGWTRPLGAGPDIGPYERAP